MDKYQRQEKQHLYSNGSCHVFAMAAATLRDDFRGYRVFFDPNETFWESDEDPDDVLYAVIHVYAVFGSEDSEVSFDVWGSRPLDETERACEDRFMLDDSFHEDYLSSEELMSLIDTEDDASRCLHSFSDQDIAEAKQDCLDMFPEFFGAKIEIEPFP